MEMLMLEWKVERTLLIEWPNNGGQEIETETRVMRSSMCDDQPHIVVNERGDAFVSMFPPTSAEKPQKSAEIKQATSMLEKETQMDMEPESQQDKHQQDKGTQESSSSSSGRKYDAEEAEITLAETMELEAALHQKQNELEQEAEQRANKLFMKWCKEKKSLEQAINELMSDHLELHEKLHALRLQFEHEKRQFSAKIMQDAQMYVNSSTATAAKGNSSSSSSNMDHQFDPQNFVHEYEGDEEREMGTKKQKGDNGKAIETTHEVQMMNTKRKFVTPSKF